MGGGVYIQDAFSPALITGNEFRSNTAGGKDTSKGEGGGLFLKGSAHVIDNNFYNNKGGDTSDSSGGAICAGYTYGPADIVISGNYLKAMQDAEAGLSLLATAPQT